MTVSISKDQLPMLEWSFRENPTLKVRTTRDGASRRFELLENGSLCGSATLAIREIGSCVQEWTRKNLQYNLSVRMFATSSRKDIYFVAVDLLHRKLEVYPENLRDEQWDARLYEEEPDLERAWFWSFIRSNTLPYSIEWDKTKTHLKEIWQRSNEKSEVGFLRTDWVDGSIYEDQVLYAAHVEFIPKAHVEFIPKAPDKDKQKAPDKDKQNEKSEVGFLRTDWVDGSIYEDQVLYAAHVEFIPKAHVEFIPKAPDKDKQNEKSEVGFLRTDWVDDSICKDQVLHAAHVEFIPKAPDKDKEKAPDKDKQIERIWKRAQVIIRRKVQEPQEQSQKELFGELLDMKNLRPDRVYLEDDPDEVYQRQVNELIMGHYASSKRAMYGVSFYNPLEETLFLSFMPGKDLASVSYEAIGDYFQKHCLNCIDGDIKAEYSHESIQVTREMHRFKNDLILHAIHIRMSQA